MLDSIMQKQEQKWKGSSKNVKAAYKSASTIKKASGRRGTGTVEKQPLDGVSDFIVVSDFNKTNQSIFQKNKYIQI